MARTAAFRAVHRFRQRGCIRNTRDDSVVCSLSPVAPSATCASREVSCLGAQTSRTRSAEFRDAKTTTTPSATTTTKRQQKGQKTTPTYIHGIARVPSRDTNFVLFSSSLYCPFAGRVAQKEKAEQSDCCLACSALPTLSSELRVTSHWRERRETLGGTARTRRPLFSRSARHPLPLRAVAREQTADFLVLARDVRFGRFSLILLLRAGASP